MLSISRRISSILLILVTTTTAFSSLAFLPSARTRTRTTATTTASTSRSSNDELLQNAVKRSKNGVSTASTIAAAAAAATTVKTGRPRSTTTTTMTTADNKNKKKEPMLSKSSSSKDSVRLPSNREKLERSYPDFPRTWVPVASTLELDPNRPSRIEFLGQSYVTYRTGNDSNSNSNSTTAVSSSSNDWVLVDNVCPHRLAPLSEGRIDPQTRTIQCSYHGWTFDGSNGSCVQIPQIAPQSREQAAAITNPKSCLNTHPTYVCSQTNVLWMWPWKEDPLSFVSDEWRHPEGITKHLFPTSATSSTTSSSSSSSSSAAEAAAVMGVTTYTRDNPYGWDTLVENLIDPAHIPFAHHGMQGSRKDAIPINMTRVMDHGRGETTTAEAGFQFDFQDRTMGMMRSGTGEFRAPYLVNYKATFSQEDGSKRPWQLSVLCVPTKPGWSRVIVLSGPPAAAAAESEGINNEEEEEDFAPKTTSDSTIASQTSKPKQKKKKKSIVSIIFRLLPTWVNHLLSNKFFDSDMAFLHYQEQLRRPTTDSGSTTTTTTTTTTTPVASSLRGDARYFMPADSDRSIAALHGWIKQYAGSYVRRQAIHLPPAIYDRKKLFDRWGQHTSHCKQCQNALTGIRAWKRNCKIIVAGSILLGLRHWSPRILAVLSFGMINLLGDIEKAFYDGEFKHYENH